MYGRYDVNGEVREDYYYVRVPHCSGCGTPLSSVTVYYEVDGSRYCEACMDGMRRESGWFDEYDWAGADEDLADIG